MKSTYGASHFPLSPLLSIKEDFANDKFSKKDEAERDNLTKL